MKKSILNSFVLSAISCVCLWMPVVVHGQTSVPQISVKKIVNASDPFAGQSLKNAHTVYTTDYPETKKHFASEVRYYDRDNNPATIERVRVNNSLGMYKFSYKKRADFSKPILKINDYKIYIAGNDGKIGSIIGTTHVVLGEKNDSYKDKRYVAREEVVSDLLNFAKSSKNHAFPVNEVEMIIYPEDRNQLFAKSGFSMYNKDISWVPKTGFRTYNYGQQVFGSSQVKTQQGLYTVTFHDTDNNLGNYECVVVKRDDGLRCKVSSLSEIRLIFVTDDEGLDDINIKCVNLSDPSIGNYTIIDYTLYDSLMTLKEHTFNNHAIYFQKEPEKRWYFIEEDGIKYGAEVWDGTQYDIW